MMKHKQHRVLSAFFLLAVLGSAGLAVFSMPNTVMAQTDSGWGPSRALAPTGDWDQLDPGEDRWYAFEYASDGSQVQAVDLLAGFFRPPLLPQRSMPQGVPLQEAALAGGARQAAVGRWQHDHWEVYMDVDGSNQRPLFDTELDGLTLGYAFAGERAISWTQ